MASRADKHGTTTITISIPTEMKAFFDEFSQSGYNRSFIMLKFIKLLKHLYSHQDEFPGGLPAEIDRIVKRRLETDKQVHEMKGYIPKFLVLLKQLEKNISATALAGLAVSKRVIPASKNVAARTFFIRVGGNVGGLDMLPPKFWRTRIEQIATPEQEE